jgi:hypothetical protein
MPHPFGIEGATIGGSSFSGLLTRVEIGHLMEEVAVVLVGAFSHHCYFFPFAHRGLRPGQQSGRSVCSGGRHEGPLEPAVNWRLPAR